MPVRVLSTTARTEYYNIEGANDKINGGAGTYQSTLQKNIAQYGFDKAAEYGLKGAIKEAIGWAAEVFTVFEIFNQIENARIQAEMDTVYRKMLSLANQAIFPGYMKITYDKCVWVSSNGEQWSGEYYRPAKAVWVSSL